ncbi:MAG: 30S ribosomal protein S3 [Candidatus Zambryskibacteria bacterium CG10_big_fil_rev_8_21_14_0_10_42_12]|uniref:Small ribosomal subunit protein uS3 n=1 Tax=Candidatus Zambryskibacteria bacterium CG10_big_fil_rev_8_21_14_0_10_42_12 TaxID=1975115 RepID=A0A2H0QWD3_9BACT|nr:MAG: 30S ribosomal protein S3 [Candidatus Zambryskibacteria bacterium CG10_big_fil_rev_8_21_14_0_10_42_12]
MSHTVHPFSHRLGIIRDWKSRWFGTKGKYQELLRSDVLIREFLEKKFRNMFVGSLEIERTQKATRIIVETARPGLIIGRNGENMDKLKKELDTLIRKKKLHIGEELKIDVKEVKAAETNASIVADMVVDQLEKRMPFRRVLKGTVEKVMANREVQGVKITLSGIMGGSAMARTETKKAGRIPLQTFRADVDFAKKTAILQLGTIGVKVWIYKGDIFKDGKKN